MPNSEAADMFHALGLKIERQIAIAEGAHDVMSQHVAEDRDNFKSLFGRMGKLENKMAWLNGGSFVALAITNLILAALQVVNFLK